MPLRGQTSTPASVDHQLGRLHFHRHVGKLEGDALELADRLAELLTRRCPFDRAWERAVGTAEAGGAHLQPGCAEPCVGDLKALVDFAEHVFSRNAAIVEFQDGVGVAAMGDVAVAVADGKAWRALVDKKAVISFLGPRGVSSSPVAMKAITKSAMSAWEMKCLVPFSTQSSPSCFALAFMPRRSEPAPGSVMARQSHFSPATQGLEITFARCSGVPAIRECWTGRATQVQCSA
jgi:hypothetical protein